MQAIIEYVQEMEQFVCLLI